LPEHVLSEDWKNGGFGIYIHWPFCNAKCPYCDFNSHVRNNIDQKQWLKSYLNEINRVSKNTSSRFLDSVFFGGGTPSLIEPWVINDILNEIQKHWTTKDNFEVTLEANPGSVDAKNFKAYRSAGVNRISIGIQSLNEKDLKALGRTHTVKEALSAFEIAQQHFTAVSFDLIYARQNQKLTQWEMELNQALDLGASHMSLYQLTIEQGTAFGDRYNRGLLKGLPSDDISAELFDITSKLCEAGAFQHMKFLIMLKKAQKAYIILCTGDMVTTSVLGLALMVVSPSTVKDTLPKHFYRLKSGLQRWIIRVLENLAYLSYPKSSKPPRWL